MMLSAMYEATFKTSSFLLVNILNLNLLQNLCGAILSAHMKFLIAWIPYEIIVFCSQKNKSHEMFLRN